MEKRSWYNLESKQFGCSHITVKKLECYLNLVTNLICFPKQFLDLFFPNTIFLDVTSQRPKKYLFLIIKYTVLGKCWLGTFPYFSECIPKKRVSRRRTSVLGGTRNCMEKWPSQQVPRKGIFSDQNYIFSHVDRVFFGSIWTNSNSRSPKVLHITV